MGELLRYIVSIDPSGSAVKVELIGEAGDLTEVDASSFIQSLGTGTAGASSAPQIVVNIYAGGQASGPARLAISRGLPDKVEGFDAGPPPPPRPPHSGKPGKPRKE